VETIQERVSEEKLLNLSRLPKRMLNPSASRGSFFSGNRAALAGYVVHKNLPSQYTRWFSNKAFENWLESISTGAQYVTLDNKLNV
jgi:hypothetical protein